ncbi:hypothetical protein HETIRDRAFT_62302 [Heterobasidion irregulare TC 32-1]|uniref:Amine oxidase n=1 Tax=Heterobasidion irregulare (strain TC 32-1) TaxID=747525 RepID=W4KD46_HETIT|nr:uncharacterized protein HETIRDRAFT_62302 [Heterobasidion irregulare TC 32-1]ETW83664.1 hypothetical protein HETIRDRAFT_62302 [Heterobasidion irregulare TC 32-1]
MRDHTPHSTPHPEFASALTYFEHFSLCTLSPTIISMAPTITKPLPSTSSPMDIGIIGGGVAGLYSALLLRKAGHNIHIFEANNRVGGRIYTHHFSSEKNQYFEAGAMRIPNSSMQKVVLDLIAHLNARHDLPSDKHIRLIPYILNSSGNCLYMNGLRRDGYRVMNTTPADINWDVPPRYLGRTAGSLLMEVLRPFLEDLERDFERGFESLLKFDSLSFRDYLKLIAQWEDEVIDFVETVCSQTNQYALGCVEIVMQHLDFMTQEWFTIEDGMDRLPQAIAHVIGLDKITFGARVTGVHDTEHGVDITAQGYNGIFRHSFDKVILAIPPAALKMIADRSRWSPAKELAIRSMHFEPLYKMGMRFKTRFWERGSANRGGQSATDLPIRWIVYPSNGIGENGPGVLLLYSWMTDASTWLSLTEIERRSLALRCLDEVYPDVDVYGQLMETFDIAWAAQNATGDAMFLPGQFHLRFEDARRPEGNVYFAGEHLSRHHTWIAGALLSALHSVQELLGDSSGTTVEPFAPIRPLSIFESSIQYDI